MCCLLDFGTQRRHAGGRIVDRWKLAHHLYRLGFSVIPLRADKRPAVRWKRYQHEHATPADLDHWFGLEDFRPGIVCGAVSGLVVVDCDAWETARRVEGSPGSSPLRQRTRRGVHFGYRLAPDDETRNQQRVGGLPIDIRGNGGYVVAYPDAARWTAHDVATAPEFGALFAARYRAGPYHCNVGAIDPAPYRDKDQP